MIDHIRRLLTRVGVWASHPIAFGLVALYGLAWLVFDPHDFGWHALAVMATWMMTLLIVRADHRDTQAIHAKLDELLTSHGPARTELATLDEQEPEEIERHRAHERRANGN